MSVMSTGEEKPEATAVAEPTSSGEESQLITWSTPVYRLGRLVLGMELVLMHRMKVEGKEHLPDEPVLLISNHQSYLDIPLVANAYRPRHVCFVARESLARSRFLAFIMRHSGAVLIERGGADRAALNDMVAHLRAGDTVCVYPEGTRSRDGTLGEFKAGALFAAKRARVPIVPVGIRGGVQAQPKGASFPRFERMGLRFGKPLDPRSKEALERARADIQTMIGDGTFASGEPLA